MIKQLYNAGLLKENLKIAIIFLLEKMQRRAEIRTGMPGLKLANLRFFFLVMPFNNICSFFS